MGGNDKSFQDISNELLGFSHPKVRANRLPSYKAIKKLIPDLIHLLFPHYHFEALESEESLARSVPKTMADAHAVLAKELQGALVFKEGLEVDQAGLQRRAGAIAMDLLRELPAIRRMLECDLLEMMAHDPAARSTEEVILAYPGFLALSVYRLAHFLDNAQIPLVPRIMSEIVHSATGIDIHPSAQIAPYCSIDHGTGLIIGETTIIGEHANLYHNVTLGSRSVSPEFRNKKRHPTLQDHVIVYPGATILGDITVGSGSVIGGNVFLLESCPPNSKIYAKPPEMICRTSAGGT